MKRVFSHLLPYWRQTLAAALLMALAALCQLMLPTLMSSVVDEGVYARDFAQILRYCGWMLVLAAGAMAATVASRKLSARVVAAFTASLQGYVFHKVMGLSHEAIGRMDTGTLVTRSTQDVSNLSWVAAELSGSIISVPVLFLGGVALTFQVDPVLALVVLCAVPLVVLAVVLVGRRAAPLWERSNAYIDQQNELIRQRLRGIRVIRAFRREDHEQEKIATATREMASNIIRANVAMGSVSPIASLCFNCAALVILYLGASRMESGVSAATGGDILALIQYVAYIMSGVLSAAFAVVMVPRAVVSARRIAQVLNLPEDGRHQGKEATLQGGITLEHVTFSFQDGAEPALQDVSMDIRPGQQVAIIGSTGSGKSTLVQLLLGFRQAQTGELAFDGEDSRRLSGACIRRQISCVLQKTAIYSGTIRENVAMGKAGATDGEIWRALEIAQLAGYVRSLPDGLDHRLELSGGNLSGGQRQRLAIARALVKDAAIYIFDDSFSALDFLTESRLRACLREYLAGKTQIVVTQRVTTAKNAGCIFVMDQGRLVDAGTHDQLLGRCPVYREIYLSQTGGDTP